MDTVNHATQGFLLGYISTGSFLIGGVCAVIGTLPDVVADLDSLGEEEWTDFSKWWYDTSHTFQMKWLNWLPPFYLHIFMDSFCHVKPWWSDESNWDYIKPWKWFKKGRRIWFESGTWILNLIIITILILI